MASKKVVQSESVSSPLEVGKSVLIRTVTMSHVGKVESIGEHEIVLSTASWVADTGRFGEAIARGTLSEVEYMGTIAVGRGALVDVAPWVHPLPTSSK